jgi:hypothetical protein
MPQHRYQCTECEIVNLYRRTNVTESGCLEWTGSLNKDGYGRLRINGREKTAHRRAWELLRGEIPDGLLVCHTCDNRSCIAIDHLFLGTDKDNSDDKVSKGRQRAVRGSLQHLAKLSESEVIVIKQRLLEGEHPSQLAREYRVARQTVDAIKYGKTWTHV